MKLSFDSQAIYDKVFLILILIFACSIDSHSQEIPNDIQVLKLSDFKGSRPANNKYPAYISTRVYYRLDSVNKIKENQYNINIKTMVVLNSDACYFDTTSIQKSNIESVLAHEQGHFYLAHIAAKIIEDRISTIVFTDNYKDEVKLKFKELHFELRKQDLVFIPVELCTRIPIEKCTS